MSYHKQDGSAAYYPDNAKQTNNEWDLYTIEVKIPWTEVNLDRSKTTAAEGDSFFMNIQPYIAGQLTDGIKTVTLGAAPVIEDNNGGDDNADTSDMTTALVVTAALMVGAVVVVGTKKR